MKRKSKKEKIIEILKVMAWLDKKRWNTLDAPFIMNGSSNKVLETLTWKQQILVHWLCYITDRMRKWEDVWSDGSQFFAELIKEYSTVAIKTESDVLKLFSRDYGFMKESKKGTIDNFASVIHPEKIYTVRYPDDLYSVARTLVLLLDHQKNLIDYISNNSCLWTNKKDNITRMSFLLFLLSYNELKDFKIECDIDNTKQQLLSLFT